MSMKEAREHAKSGMSAKLKRFGGRPGPMSAMKGGGKACYATGGATGAANAGPVGGEPEMGKLSRPSKSKGKSKKGKAETHVNVVVMGKGDGMPPGGPPAPGPMMPPPMAAPPMRPPMPPMPPPGAGPGGPGPMPMPPPGGPPGMMPHKHGGAVSRKTGGKVRGVEDGAGGGKGRLEKIKMYGSPKGRATGMTK
jgi:hypothetical protein